MGVNLRVFSRDTSFKVLLVSVVAVAVLASILYFTSRNSETSKAPTENRLLTDIAEAGVERAYEEFAKENESEGLSLQEQHKRAHAFASDAYRAVGLSALSVCDNRFFYACFHEIVGRTIIDHGLSIIPQLLGECRAKQGALSTGCRHGIGHGLISILGYDKQGMVQALRQCRIISVDDPRGGCFTGAVMEYTLRSMFTADPGRHLMELTDSNTFEPCDAFNQGQERQWCIFWLPPWWRGVLSGDRIGKYTQMGAWCESLSVEERKVCYEGIGKITIFEPDPTPESTASLCAAAVQNNAERLWCHSSAAFYLLYLKGPEMQKAAEAICVPFSGSSLEYCKKYGTENSALKRFPAGKDDIVESAFGNI